jgi:hypothetical protein
MKEFETIFPFVFPLFFVGMWCLVLRILSFVSGWAQLAELFYHPEKFRGKYYRFQSARIKEVSFSCALEMGVNEKGLYLIPMILFRLFHKPLLIPWREIHSEPFRKFLFHGYRLTFASLPNITIDLYGNTFNKMTEYLKSFQQSAGGSRC